MLDNWDFHYRCGGGGLDAALGLHAHVHLACAVAGGAAVGIELGPAASLACPVADLAEALPGELEACLEGCGELEAGDGDGLAGEDGASAFDEDRHAGRGFAKC